VDQSKLKTLIDVSEQIFRLSRDAAIGLIFLLLVAFPGYVKNRLVEAGFTKIEKGGVTWENGVESANNATKAAATTVSEASQTIQDVTGELSALASQAHNPIVKTRLQNLADWLNGSLGNVQKADQSLQETVLTQQELLSQSSRGSVTQGWLYVGEIDANRQNWAEGSPKNILPAGWPLTNGQSVTAAGLNYLRADPSTGQNHNNASVAAVVRDRTKLTIQDIQYAHALNGTGQFVWLKVVAQ
jgi:hypothetical protein